MAATSSDAPILFCDLDGTLTDSGPGIIASIRRAYEWAGVPVPDAAALRTFIGPPIHDSLLRHGVPTEVIDGLVAEYRRVYGSEHLLTNSVYPGIPEALETLRSAGVRLAVATSKPEPFARIIIDHFTELGPFEVVAGATFDSTRGTKALVISHAIAQVGPFGPALMLGDRHHDVDGAAEHGFGCIGAGWGYGSADELGGAVTVIADPSQLAATVLGLLG